MRKWLEERNQIKYDKYKNNLFVMLETDPTMLVENDLRAPGQIVPSGGSKNFESIIQNLAKVSSDLKAAMGKMTG